MRRSQQAEGSGAQPRTQTLQSCMHEKALRGLYKRLMEGTSVGFVWDVGERSHITVHECTEDSGAPTVCYQSTCKLASKPFNHA